MAALIQGSDRPADAPRDRVPEFVALGSFITVGLLAAGLILIQFQVPQAVLKFGPWVGAIAIAFWIRWSVPSSRLAPARRVQREERRAGVVVGALSACAVLGAVAAATYLTSWSQWLVLGSLVTLAIGGIITLHVRFTIGA